MVAFEKYNHGHAARAVSTMVELESYYTGKATRVVIVIDPMSVSAIEDVPDNPDATSSFLRTRQSGLSGAVATTL